jgi:DNA-binding NtrC family response regulator
MAHGWPGNVREVQNVIERAAIVCAGDELCAEDLDFGRRPVAGAPSAPAAAAAATTAAGPAAGAAQPLRTRLAEEEKASIIRAIEGSGGNIAAAARALGINRSTLYFRIKKYELDYLLPNKLGGGPEAQE